MHESSYLKVQDFVERYLGGMRDQALTVVDFGSQDVNGVYKPLFECPRWRYVGIDVAAGRNVDVVLKDPYFWDEVKSASVDVLISGSVFEHVEYFWLSALEVGRVLKPAGLCCIIAPSRGPAHRYPVDCWRFYRDGLLAIAHYADMEVLEASVEDRAERQYGDNSIEWGDSLLIARKLRLTWLGRMKRCALRWARKHLSSL